MAAVSAVLYARTGASWWLFAALWLTPDLSMLGYLAGSCWGARSYNAVHTYVVPGALALSALLAECPRSSADCAHLGESHRRRSAHGLRTEVFRRLWLDPPWAPRQAQRYFAGSELIERRHQCAHHKRCSEEDEDDAAAQFRRRSSLHRPEWLRRRRSGVSSANDARSQCGFAPAARVLRAGVERIAAPHANKRGKARQAAQ